MINWVNTNYEDLNKNIDIYHQWLIDNPIGSYRIPNPNEEFYKPSMVKNIKHSVRNISKKFKSLPKWVK
jgi:hypothetical protein